MKISYSELILLGNPVLENMKNLIDLGAKRIELMMDGRPWDTEKTNWDELARELKKLPVEYSVHPPAWDINLTSQIKELREAALDLHIKALDFSHKIAATQMVVHPGFLGSKAFDKGEAGQRAREITNELAKMAKPLGLTLAFENVGYNGQSIYTFEEYIHALDGVDENVRYLIDIGHANINGWDIGKLIRVLAPRICGLHIHDNNGKEDQHLPMYEGTVKWDEVFEAMKLVPKEAEFILEYAPGTSLETLVKGEKILLDKVGRK